MAGYCDFSKSNNALEAEAQGRYPASFISKELKIPAKFITDNFSSSEWHHCSKMFNIVLYYDLEEITDKMQTEEYQIKLREFKLKQKENKNSAKVYVNCDIVYLVWGGTRNFPKATEEKLNNVTIKDEGGKFVKVFSDIECKNLIFRKGKQTRGFEARQNGIRIY